MVSFKILCCFLPVVTEDNHERSGQSAYMDQPNCKPQIHIPLFQLHILLNSKGVVRKMKCPSNFIVLEQKNSAKTVIHDLFALNSFNISTQCSQNTHTYRSFTACSIWSLIFRFHRHTIQYMNQRSKEIKFIMLEVYLVSVYSILYCNLFWCSICKFVIIYVYLLNLNFCSKFVPIY